MGSASDGSFLWPRWSRAKDDVQGGRKLRRVKADCPLVLLKTGMGPGSETTYSIPTLLERAPQCILEKTKMKWETEPSVLKCFKEARTSVVPEDRLQVEGKRFWMCLSTSLVQSCPLNQAREATPLSSTPRGLCSGPSLAILLPKG